MWNIRDGTVVRALLTGAADIWQVVFEGRYCVAATSSKQNTTVMDVWDFGVGSVGLLEDTQSEDEDHTDLDEEEDQGTYKIKAYVPGDSHGTNISSRVYVL
jgi:F-box and WD-40 domain protein CDC4